MIADHHIELGAGSSPPGPVFHMTVHARPAAVTEVRRALTEWGSFLPPDRLGDLVIAANEVVSNSIRHGPAGGRVEVRAARAADGVRVEACDEGHGTVATNPAPGADGGFGLGIVETLACRWGVTAEPTCVWFVLPTTVA
jgi:serine/threonine-protein kinase RsbW